MTGGVMGDRVNRRRRRIVGREGGVLEEDR